MASMLVTLRTALATEITARKTALSYVVNTFEVEETWMPLARLEELAADHPDGKVYLVGMASDDLRAETRTNVCRREYAVMIGIQKAGIAPTDKASIDQLVELDEELRETCRQVAVTGYSWIRNEALKDDAGTPYSYVMLREALTFESYFTAFWNVALG